MRHGHHAYGSGEPTASISHTALIGRYANGLSVPGAASNFDPPSPVRMSARASSQGRTSVMSEKAQIGVTGLAVMGRNLARNFARHGHTVAVHNRSYGRTKEL